MLALVESDNYQGSMTTKGCQGCYKHPRHNDGSETSTEKGAYLLVAAAGNDNTTGKLYLLAREVLALVESDNYQGSKDTKGCQGCYKHPRHNDDNEKSTKKGA